MAVLALVGMSLFLLSCFAVGLRLVALWHRTGQLPELMIGLSFLLAGGLGGVTSTVGGELRATNPELAAQLLVLGTLLIHGGVLCLTYFVWKVFRPGASILAGIVGLGLIACASGTAIDGLRAFQGGPWSWTSIGLRIFVYAWAAFESFREAGAAKRRLAVGLSNRLVVNRFQLWGWGALAIVLLWVHSGWLMLLGDQDVLTESYLVITGLGMVCAVTFWLAFFPPASWRQRFDSASEAS